MPRNEDRHIAGATMCALLRLPDRLTLVRLERLRYLRQLVHAPEALWARIRLDGPFMEKPPAALLWLYARLQDTTAIDEPLAHWDRWADASLLLPHFNRVGRHRP